ncbi:FecCD family ABC transporter permease [Streptomyces griseoviridis]|uniref:Iron ABC transporter permease n=1 Tax=Streptomyces hintoniae TaxID=3075521 RepID=A0ABU2UTQ5_9ACTN|nr:MULTISPECIES: iron ABC transporter permease [unclassified Streptomyces]MDH6697315.1 iron complex transport system permease protein [Streptomyces sp. MAA16]MDT0476675.1 iron ABC transporter permease [Streptomyces sp. DSM 41014]
MTTTDTAPVPRTAPGGRAPRRVRRWPLAALLPAALAALAAVCFASVMYGSKSLSATEVWDALGGHGDAYAVTVVESRYPRTVLGLLAGAALAVAGILMQAVARNPLAEPGLLGINTGAAAAVVTGTALGLAGDQGAVLLWALPGAVLTGLAVHVIGTAGGTASPVRLVLAGAVLSAVLTAYIQALTLSRPQVFDSYRYWVVGALGGHSMASALTVLPLVLGGLLVALALGRGLNALALGDDSAAGLGARPGRVKAVGLLTATVLSAAATAAVGPIAFVGLAVPHLVRAVAGVDRRAQTVLAVLVGPTLLLAADIAGRLLLRPQELMVGVVTAFVGAPALLLAVRTMKAAS